MEPQIDWKKFASRSFFMALYAETLAFAALMMGELHSADFGLITMAALGMYGLKRGVDSYRGTAH